jgi:metal-sulfur cluster biosynthetic enzyme
MSGDEALTAALSRVRDPELDEPITDLGFVSELRVDGTRVNVRLRLPTYFCAPNFAYLMVADARAALESVPGVHEARVVLEDHFASPEINGGVNVGSDFVATFPGLADGELAELRSLFDRKAFLVRQQRLCEALLARGVPADDLAGLSLGELPEELPETAAYLERRVRLGLDVSPGAPLLVRPNGERIAPGEAPRQLRFARTVRVSIEGNADLCRGLLRTRYGPAEDDDDNHAGEGHIMGEGHMREGAS